MRIRVVLVAYLAAAASAAALAVPVVRAVLPTHRANAAPAPVPAPPPSNPPYLAHLRLAPQPAPPPAGMHIPADPAAIKGPGYLNFFGWALLDRRTGQATGPANRET